MSGSASSDRAGLPPVSRQLRIVHCFRAPVGGVFRHVRDLVEAQSAAGHSVGIICDSTSGGEFQEQLFEEMKDSLALGIWRTPMQRQIGPGDLSAAWRTYCLIKRLQPDILHGHGAKGGFYARLFGSLLRVSRYCVARLYSPHGGSLHHDATTAAGKLVFGLERAMERLTDHLLFVSDYERRIWLGKIGPLRAPNSVIYNGLRPGEFEPVAEVHGAADFLFIGEMRDLKGPDLFIDALATASAALARPLTAVMVGDGKDKAQCQQQAERLGLSDRIAFHGSMPARQAFALAKVMVVPSRAEAMPYIVLEALAAGKPIIATAVGGIPEILGSDSGALVRPDATDLAIRMREAVEDTIAFRNRMPSLESLRQRFGLATMAARVEEAYRAALGSRS